MPSFHCATTSIQENKWNSKSCPEGFPQKKKGTTTANAVAATTATRRQRQDSGGSRLIWWQGAVSGCGRTRFRVVLLHSGRVEQPVKKIPQLIGNEFGRETQKGGCGCAAARAQPASVLSRLSPHRKYGTGGTANDIIGDGPRQVSGGSRGGGFVHAHYDQIRFQFGCRAQNSIRRKFKAHH
jgi:hypothetical protein